MKSFDLWQSQVIFLTVNSSNKEKVIKQLISKQSQKEPDRFYGEVPCVCYKVNYVPPFEEFKELKNLIIRIKENTGLRSEFRGVVALNVDEWIGHEHEDYFSVFLKYLHDHSEFIQYIFYSHLNHPLQDMMKVVIQYLTLQVQSIDEYNDIHHLYRVMKYKMKCQHMDISLDDTIYLTDEILKRNIDLYNESIQDSIILDINHYLNNNIINSCIIDDYMHHPSNLVNMIGER
ncbi:MAG: hypothetical protein LUG60_12810 [Erysipelotrichaceae bacterium]|nr:hypothetical protein [Erysipelotrichaceae bacterium]